MQLLVYLGLAVLVLPLQTVLLPALLPGGVKPDLFLLLAIWIGLREPPWRGGAMAYALGWLYDAHAGVYPGLHGFVLLAVCLLVSGVATRLNTESLPLLWYLIGGGTLLQAGLMVFALEFFAETEQFWVLVARGLPAQLLLNVLAGHLLQGAGRRLRRAVPLTPLRLLLPSGRRHEP
jgi:rod shape-determining protein MreD